MTHPRSRAAASVLVSLVAIVLLAAPTAAGAQANDPVDSTYSAKADATALDLKVFGKGVTIGLTHTEVSSDPHTKAGGIGLVLPDSTLVSDEQYESSTDGESLGTATPTSCKLVTPASFSLAQMSVACANGAVSILKGLPTAAANAVVTNLTVNGTPVLSQLPIAAITDQVSALLDQLKPLFDTIKNDTSLDAQSLLSQLIDDINAGGDLVRITLGPASSASAATADTVHTGSSALGGVIEVLPRDTLPVPLPPLLKIEVGAGSTTIDFDRTTGLPTVNVDPALVRVTLAADIAGLLGLPAGANVVQVAPGQSKCFDELPDPLKSCISVASGTSSTENNVTRASTSGVSLHLLTGLSDGVRLDLVNTAVEGTVDVVKAQTPPPDLPRTGGTVDTVLGGSLLALALGGLVIVRRSGRRVEIL